LIIQFITVIQALRLFDLYNATAENIWNATNLVLPLDIDFFDKFFSSIETAEKVSSYYGNVNDISATLTTLFEVCIVIMTCRGIAMLNFHPDSAILSRTISHSLGELTMFSIVFVLVLFSYRL